MCEINAHATEALVRRRLPPLPPSQCCMAPETTHFKRKWAFISHARQPSIELDSATLRCGARGGAQAGLCAAWAFISHTPDPEVDMLGVILDVATPQDARGARRRLAAVCELHERTRTPDFAPTKAQGSANVSSDNSNARLSTRACSSRKSPTREAAVFQL